MYLLLVENNFISSREIKGLLDKNSIKCEIVNCSSSEALSVVAEKLSPDIVIIDFDFFIDDSAEIVRKLRNYSPKAYILAFIDPDHYEKLHLAIELGIDDYLVKPLQRDDVMLRIKMGLQRKNVQFTQIDAMDTPVDADIQADEQSKKLILDSNDTFGQQYKTVEKSFFTAQEVENKIEQLSESENKIEQLSEEEDGGFEVVTEIPDMFPQEGPLLEQAVSEETVEKEIIGEFDNDSYEDELFSIQPELQQDQFAIGELWNEPEYSDAELPVNDKEQADLSRGETDSLSDHNQDYDGDSQYFDELFRTRSDSEPADIAIEIEEPIFSKTGLPDQQAKSKIGLTEESSGKLDDSKLFGMSRKERTVDTKSFEEIFGTANVKNKRKTKASSEHRTEKDKPGKVEYLFSANTVSAEVKTTSSERAVNHDLFGEDSYVKPTTHRQDRGYSQKAKGSIFLKIAGNVLTASLLVLLITLSFFLIQSKISGGTPALAGYKMYVVLSGSMSPAFNTGSLVFVKSTDPVNITEGDIITFSSANASERLTTHRVVGINRENDLSFITRGDANNVNDPNPVAAENIVGRVTGSIPYIGYLLGYAQTRQGLILMVFIPGFLILIFELRKLYGYMVEAKTNKLTGNPPEKPSVPVYQANRQNIDAVFGGFDISGEPYRQRSK